VAFTQRWPDGQSRLMLHAWWHLPNVHDSGLLQSLLTAQVVPADGVLLDELHPTARTSATPNHTLEVNLGMAGIIDAFRANETYLCG
jgi:hypothetical protein